MISNMKKTIIFIAVIGLFSFSGLAQARTVSVRSYYKPSTHSYIQSYYKTSPNHTKLDNYSTKGNYNPYTGKWGTKSPYKL